MSRILLSATITALALGFNAMSLRAADDQHHEHFMKCAKACADCQLQCEMCFQHCSGLVVQGEKSHAATMRSCSDCAEVCKLAATLSARGSSFAAPSCELCAKVCDQCATACEKFPQDKHMADCAKSCRDCAKACREMVAHAGH